MFDRYKYEYRVQKNRGFCFCFIKNSHFKDKILHYDAYNNSWSVKLFSRIKELE